MLPNSPAARDPAPASTSRGPSAFRVRLQTACAILAAMVTASADASAAPSRIVAAGGAITEILYRLDRGTAVVGVDSTSLYPEDALRTKPNIGYVRALGAEGILSLRPDLVLAIEGAGPPAVLDVVRAAGVPVVRLADRPTAEGVVQRIRDVAKAVGSEAEGEQLVRETQAGFAAVALRRTQARPAQRVLMVLSIQNGRPLVAGAGTSGAAVLDLVGADNAAAGIEGWKAMSDEALIAAAPDQIVLLRRDQDFDVTREIAASPALMATPAGTRSAAFAMDSLQLLGFGPRTPAALMSLMDRLDRSAAANRP